MNDIRNAKSKLSCNRTDCEMVVNCLPCRAHSHLGNLSARTNKWVRDHHKSFDNSLQENLSRKGEEGTGSEWHFRVEISIESHVWRLKKRIGENSLHKKLPRRIEGSSLHQVSCREFLKLDMISYCPPSILLLTISYQRLLSAITDWTMDHGLSLWSSLFHWPPFWTWRRAIHPPFLFTERQIPV